MMFSQRPKQFRIVEVDEKKRILLDKSWKTKIYLRKLNSWRFDTEFELKQLVK